jgi:hypothetical protein
MAIGEDKWEVDDFWIRLRIANSGKAAAMGVEVIVRDLLKRDPVSSEFISDRAFLPLSLKWSNVGNPVLSRIPASIEKHCDLFRILDPSVGALGLAIRPAEPLRAVLQLEVHPNVNPGILGPGDYGLTIIATAENCEASRYEVWFTIPTLWSDERTLARTVSLRGLPSRSGIMLEAN